MLICLKFSGQSYSLIYLSLRTITRPVYSLILLWTSLVVAEAAKISFSIEADQGPSKWIILWRVLNILLIVGLVYVAGSYPILDVLPCQNVAKPGAVERPFLVSSCMFSGSILLTLMGLQCSLRHQKIRVPKTQPPCGNGCPSPSSILFYNSPNRELSRKKTSGNSLLSFNTESCLLGIRDSSSKQSPKRKRAQMIYILEEIIQKEFVGDINSRKNGLFMNLIGKNMRQRIGSLV
jgi:hypothetical protein